MKDIGVSSWELGNSDKKTALRPPFLPWAFPVCPVLLALEALLFVPVFVGFFYTRIGMTTKVVLASAGSFTSTGEEASLRKKVMSSPEICVPISDR